MSTQKIPPKQMHSDAAAGPEAREARAAQPTSSQQPAAAAEDKPLWQKAREAKQKATAQPVVTVRQVAAHHSPAAQGWQSVGVFLSVSCLLCMLLGDVCRPAQHIRLRHLVPADACRAAADNMLAICCT